MLKTNFKKWATFGCLALMTTFAQAQGIEFEHGSWEEVKAVAKKENKPIFVDAYTTWCGPCKWMAANVFVQEEVGAYFKENFIAYKMDMEKGEGPEFAKLNKVMAYPTLLYFSADGELVHKGIGARDAEGLVSLCNSALDPEQQLMSFIQKYEDGNRDKKFLAGYLQTLSSCGEEITPQFGEYWKMLDDTEKQTSESLDIMMMASSYFSDFKHPLSQYLISNKEAYAKTVGAKKVNEYLEGCYTNSTITIARKNDAKVEKELGKELLTLFPNHKSDYSKYAAFIKLAIQEAPDEAKYKKAHENYLKVSKNANDLNGGAWGIYESSEDPKELKKALAWVNRSIDIEKSYANVDTKAAVLFKLKDYEGAQKAAEEAIKLSEESGMGTPEETVQLLENIKSKLN